MCMITTAARIGGEASKGNTSAACGVLRGSSRETSENAATDSEESPRSSNLAPTSQIEGLAKDVATTEKRRGTTIFSASSGESPPKKQRIQVIVRIRPIEDKAGRTTTVLADGRTLCLAPAPKGAKEKLDQGRLRESRKELEVTFDRVLGESAEQKEVYDQVKACVRLPFSGVNSCIFAYGQTGSGKTYSMMGGMSQLEAEKEATAANNDGLLSSSKPHPESLGKFETIEGDGAERSTAGKNSSKEGHLGAEVAGDTAGIIPRAVDDIFRIVRQGEAREESTVTTPRPSASAWGSFRESPEIPQPPAPPPETAPSPSTACGSGCASAPDTSTPGTSYSTRSSASSSSEDSSEDCSLSQVPSAAHWPLSEPTVYAPRAQTRREDSCSSARQRVQPFDDSEKSDTVGTEEGGGSDEKLAACQEEPGETVATCKYSVQCSYLQVYNGRVYDLLSPHASQHKPLPVFTSARQGTASCFSVEGREENADCNGDASIPINGKRRFPSFSRRESCSGSRLIGLSSHEVDSPEQVMELLRQGARNRRVRSTEMNTHSSRSHTIVQFTISRTTGEPSPPASHVSSGGESIGAALGSTPTATTQRRQQHQPRGKGNNADGVEAGSETCRDRGILHGSSTNVSSGGESCVYPIVTTRAKLSLVDLAGSEKGRVGGERGTERGESPSQAGSMPAQGEDGREAQERERARINSSLSALSNCISCLGEARRKHVPFRDNPLTRLLQDSLVGGKTVVIATIRPSVDAQAESISTLNFAARCMRVVARQRVNEVVTDSLLLERARRQISALRRRLVEAEAAAAIASSPAPSHHHLPLEKAEPLPASAKTPPAPPPPPPPPPETEAVVSATSGTSGGLFGGSDDNGSGGVGRDETVRSGGGRRCEKYASLVAVPIEARLENQPAGEKLVGNNNNEGASEGAKQLKMEANSLRRCANTGTQPPELVLKSEAKSPAQRPLQADEGTLDRGVNNGHPRRLQVSSSLLSGGREGKREGGIEVRTLLNARRGRDVVIRDKIATAVAAANAAAAAATAVASAISAAGGGRGRPALANKHATPTTSSAAAVQHGSSRRAVRSQLRKPGDILRTTRASKPAFRPSCSSTSGGPALPARGANSPAAASTTRVAVAGGWRVDETSVATQALIERFFSREEELLRELEAWKARCKSLEKKEAPPTSISGGCSLAGQNGGGTDERRVGEKPTRLGIGDKRVGERPTRLEAASTVTRAVPAEPATPAKPQRPLQAIPGASPSIGISEEKRRDATQASDDTHRLVHSGVGTVSVPKNFVPEEGRNVDPPRRARIEVLQQCADGWWYRRLPHVPRKPCREEAGANRRLEGEASFKPGEHLPRAVHNRVVVPASGVVVAERVALQDGREETHGIDKLAREEADVERAAPRKEQPGENKVGGEKYGESKAPTPVAVESKVRLPQNEGAEIMQVGERSLSKSFGAKDKTSYGGDDDRGGHGNDGNSRPAESVLCKPRVTGVAVDAAPTRRSLRGIARIPRSPQGKAETHRKGSAGQGTTAGGSHLEIRSSFAARGLEVAPTPSLSLPLSPDPVRDTGFVNAAKIDGKGCQRHGLALCSLCGAARDSSPLRLSDDGLSAPPIAETVKGDGPCDRHLLLDCILCKMLSPALRGDGLPPASFGGTTAHQHVLGRSTSLPALGGTAVSGGGGRANGGGGSGGGTDMTGVHVPVTATKPALDRAGSPSTYRCDRHDLVGCFLCGSRVKSPIGPRGGGSADSRRADDGLAFSPSPPQLVLPSPTLRGGGLQVGGASPVGAFIDQPLRTSKGAGAALGPGSANSEIDFGFNGGEGGNSGVTRNEDPELFGRSILFRAPHRAGAARKMSTDAAAPNTEAEEVGAEPVVADDAKDADFCGVDRRPSSSQPTPSRGGFQIKNTSSGTTENGSLAAAGSGTVRARGSPDRMNHAGHDDGKSSTDGARARGVPGRRGVDAAGDAVRHCRQHRSRGGTPRRRRTPSKPSMTNFVSRDPGRSRGNRSLRGSNNREIGRVVRARAHSNTVVSATQAREKLGDEDLAARAKTAALAVLK